MLDLLLSAGAALIFLLFLLRLSLGAFSVFIRKQIGRRDRWTCQEPGCNKSFQTGWMVEAAHYPEHHNRSDPIYDTPEAGRILCIRHHQEEHEAGTVLGRKADDWAVERLREKDRRTFWWRRRHG